VAVVEQAAASSRTTHAARRPVDTCKLLAAMTAALIRGEPAAAVFQPGFWSQGELHEAVAAVASGSWRGKEPPAIRGTGYCVAALEAAIWAVAGARDFRDAILRATNLGDDADTTAAIAGQLAGAMHGASGIPPEWLGKLAMRGRIESLADALHRAAAGRRLLWEHVPTIAARHGVAIERLSHPIPDQGVTAPEHYDRIMADIERALAGGRKVFVHCWGGIGRTGTVVGIWHVYRGHSPEAALERIAAARRGTMKGDRPSPETPVQIEAIRQAHARRRPSLL